MSITPRRRTHRARALRRAETSAEARLWNRLRDRRLHDFKFVRQVPIGPYIADFLCREARFIVEVDGATHSQDREIAYDGRREAYLETEGFRILRVTNDDVFRRIESVLETILARLEGTP
jgi:very-short-patch-repair endonuclease